MNLGLDSSWLMLGLPLMFAVGWVASRLDLRQLKRESQDDPRALHRGLTLLFNEQPDAAIDAFITALQNDPDAVELHFALGQLFRRRGEFERAIRVHQHLLQRGDLRERDRDRAQLALAQDYAKAQLMDRAEQAYRALEGTSHDAEAKLALLSLQEQARDWLKAAKTAQALEASGNGNFAKRMAHHLCERAKEADERAAPREAESALSAALEAAPLMPRPWIELGRRHAKASEHREACQAWLKVVEHHASATPLIAMELATHAQHAGMDREALQALQGVHARKPNHDIAQAMGVLLREDDAARASRLGQQLAIEPTLGIVSQIMKQVPPEQWSHAMRDVMAHTVARAAEPRQKFRCAACGFLSLAHGWQCPSCRGWDTFPPTRVDEA
jgi:lipopolysaccharide assembly protein B